MKRRLSLLHCLVLATLITVICPSLQANLSWEQETNAQTNTLLSVASNGTTLVAVGVGGVAVSSTDGSTWAAEATNVTSPLRGLAANSNVFLAVGNSGLIVRRSSGVWQTISSGVTAENLYGVAVRSSGEAMIVGNGGVILHRATSADDFTIVDAGFTTNFRSVVYADGAWVVGGDDGVIVRSSNLTDWTTVQAADELLGYIQSMAYVGNGVISAARTDGGMQRSSDYGETWNNIILDNSPGVLYGVAQNGGAVLSVGSLGGALLSDNGGTSFVGAYTGQSNNVYGVAAFGSGSSGLWVAVGDGGLILSAPLSSGTNTGFVSLAVTSPVVASNTITSNGTFSSVHFDVENDGLADLPYGEEYTTNLYLSSSTVPEQSDTPIAGPTVEDNGLASGESNTILYQDVEIGNELAGDYFLISEVIFTSAGETVRRFAYTQITIVPNFNLEITTPVLSSSNAGAGESLNSVSAFVSNAGTQTSPNYSVRVYLSQDTLVDGVEDYLLSEKTDFAGLDAGASSQVVFESLEIPSVMPGAYYILVQVESDSAGATFAATTDVGSAAIQIFGPDVLISDYQLYEVDVESDTKTASSSLQAGDPFELDFVIRNSGLGSVAEFTTINTRVFLSTDQSLSTSSDVQLGSNNYSDGLESGASSPSLSSGSPLDIVGVIPANTISSSYYLLLVTDYNTEVSEQNESNNMVSIPITVAGYNLSVTSPLIPELAEPGETISLGSGSTIPAQISITAQNVGQSVFDQTYQVELYLSEDTTLGPEDVLLGQSAEYTDGLASFGSRVINFNNIDLPNTELGAYYLLSHINLYSSTSGLELPDRQASDNTRSTQIEVTGPDLFVNEFIVSNTSILNSGSFGVVSFNLTNQGAGAVPVGTDIKAEIYLSVDEAIDASTDVRLGQISYNQGLEAGEVLPLSTASELTPPTDIPSGIYNMIVVVNSSGNIAETGTSSNQASVQVNIGLLDIQVSAPNIDATRYGVNEMIENIIVNVTNDSGFTISNAELKLFLSTSESISTGSVELGSSTIASISASDAEEVQFADIDVGNIVYGDVYLIARVYLPEGLTDFIPENNQASTAITVTLPNLAPTNIALENDEIDIDTPVLPNVVVTVNNSAEGIIPSVANGGQPINMDIYLSVDSELSDDDLELDASQTYVAGLSGNTSFSYDSFDINLPGDTLGGDYFLIFQVNPEGLVIESTSANNTLARSITVSSDNAPGPAFDYFLTLVNEFNTVDDPYGTDGSVLRSPILTDGETASVVVEIEGPTTINVPWRIEGRTGDSLQVFIDDVLYSEIVGFDPIYQSEFIEVPAGRHEVEWLFTRGDQGTDEFIFGYIDLDRPRYSNPGAAEWVGVADPSAKVGSTVVEVSTTEASEEAILELDLVGPGLVTFWWKFDSPSALDSLSFSIDGEVQYLATSEFGETRVSSILFGDDEDNEEWTQVAFLLYDGEHTLRWTAKDVSGEGLVANLDGLTFLTPIPEATDINRDNSGDEYANIPPTNHDPAIVQITSNPGTYLLDDAAGTSRLPVSVTVKNVGASYSSDPGWLSSSLELHLSGDAEFGGSDDYNLGQFSNLQIQTVGQQQVVFSGDVNLPFNLPEGDFYLLARFTSQFNTDEYDYEEFTLANNIAGMGSVGAGDNSEYTYLPNPAGGGVVGANPGFTILRRPDLVINGYTGPSVTKPYHPEEDFYIAFDLANLGLGDVTPDESFNIRIELHCLDVPTPLVKAYPELTQTVFLPAQSPEFPDEWSTPIVFQGQMPSTLEFVIPISDLTLESAEDLAAVYEFSQSLDEYEFAFVIIVDSQNDVLESSETNTFSFSSTSSRFHVMATPYLELYESYIASPSYLLSFGLGIVSGDGVVLDAGAGDNPLIDPLGDYDGDGLLNWLEYAFATDPTEARELYNYNAPGNSVYQNGITFIDLEGLGLTPFLTLEFDVNVRAVDFEMVVEGSSNLVDWEEVVTISPPFDTRDSLTGSTGLLAHPYVLAVEGNATDVQQIYSARVLVRDSEPYTGTDSRFMRVRVAGKGETLDTPSNLQLNNSLVLSWDSDLPVGASYLIVSSSSGEPGTYEYVTEMVKENTFTQLQVSVPSLTRFYQIYAYYFGELSAPATYYPAPDAPDNVLAQSLATGGVQLSWDESEYNVVSSYRILRAFDFDLDFIEIATTETTSYFDDEGGAGYYYQIIASNDAGESPESSALEASAYPPTNFDAAIDPGGVLISWDLPSDINVSMVIQRRSAGNPDFSTIQVVGNQHITDTYLDTFGDAGDEYRGFFRGSGSQSPSGYSDIVIAD